MNGRRDRPAAEITGISTADSGLFAPTGRPDRQKADKECFTGCL
jgi:hypothetical protein